MERTDRPDAEPDHVLTYSQAYEAAYRFVWQYALREPIDPFLLMLVAMEPTGSQETSDPASWHDWIKCAEETVAEAPLPRFPLTNNPT